MLLNNRGNGFCVIDARTIITPRYRKDDGIKGHRFNKRCQTRAERVGNFFRRRKKNETRGITHDYKSRAFRSLLSEDRIEFAGSIELGHFSKRMDLAEF